MLRTVFKNEKG